jgi:CDP-diacylglycerol--serine O-phosphatidyltransferase
MATFPRRRKPGVPKAAKTPGTPRFSKFARQPAVGADGKPQRRRGIYLLPNAFTTAALFCGFYAIVMAMNQRFEQAAWAIFIAMVLDGLDGRIARLTNTQSEFGAQYDSLSDMVSFGAAPALVVYEWSLRGLGKLGWIAAFVYCAGAALRLALFAGLTMVTNVPFYSFKDVNFRKSVPFIAVFLIALAFALVSIDPPKVLMPIFVVYGLSGYVVFFWRLAKGKPVSIIQTDDEPVDQSERR